jgi:UDP:flavonoid glycosyltransferase YjiC (YdhE family)
MHITIIALGSRGDVQPYVALGTGLKAAGHAVCVLTSQDFEHLVVSSGLEFQDTGGNLQAVAQGMQGLLEQGNFLKILAKMGAAAEQMISQATRSGLVACRGADLIVAGLGGLYTGVALSEKLDIPCLPALYYPFTPTREFPNALVPLPPVRLPGWLNRLTHLLARQMFWQNFRAADGRARREILQLAPAPFFGPFAALERRKTPVLYGYSPQVLPPPADWEPYNHVTGYWFLDPPEGWEPPGDLVRFLRAGPPPVYIGFGSMVNARPEETTRLVLEALARTGQRGVLAAGWGGLMKANLPDSVFMLDPLPYYWLFPRMAAVVHHGGGGTTATGLWAGVPSVVIPFMGDQPFWGQRVQALGVGPRPIPRRRLTAERLAEAIQIALSDRQMQERAARLGERIRAEDGIGQAVAVIEQSR